MNPDDTYMIAQAALGVVGGIFAIAMLLQKFLNTFKADKAESSVITLMHAELERMSEQNTKLSIELGKLQNEVIELNKELRALTVENQRLHSEVQRLTDEITKFKELAGRAANQP